MATRRRRLTRGRQRALKPSVQHFLDTGDLGPAERDSPWLAFELTYHGEQLRAALALTDPEARGRLLAKIPAVDQLFV